MLTLVAEMSQKFGWESSGRLEDRVVSELEFWRENLRRLNGWPMRGSEDVLYCKDGSINMFSDVSEVQLAGARIEGGKVSWDSRFKASLTEGELGSSSTYRELRAIKEGLLANSELLSSKVVRWGTDN